GRLYGHPRQRHDARLVCERARERASGRPHLPRRRRRGDPLGHDPRHPHVGGEPGYRADAGLPRARRRGAHEPAGDAGRQLGVAHERGRALDRAGGARRRDDPDLRQGAWMIRRPVFTSRPDQLSDDPLWYKDAIIYELRVRSYADSDGDGVGDLRGLASKLDYIVDLGVTALWLLPICPSPMRDDGYDISEYCDVHPDVGTLDDFRYLLDEAHRRGLRIITELVLNHTSDQHPWFQRARRAPAGSAERNFYVWSDTQEKYRDARIIFKDFEVSNWTWDALARQFYWHRFYAHQPDVNFEEPAVHEAMFGVVDFWLGLGVDGLRLDAVPYLYEREGTMSENLPETHAFLKQLRRHMDEKWKNRMLLAEANQWPEDA